MIRPTLAQNTSGFTLVEMLIAVFIALIIFGVGFATITGTMRARAESEARIHSTENARIFFQTLEKDFASAYPDATSLKEDLVETGTFTYKAGTFTNTFDSNALQFYTRVDTPGDSKPLVVHYYVNKRQQVVREVIADATALPQLSTSNLDSEEHAMFDRVHSLHITFHKWDPINKNFTPQMNLSTTLPVGTVTIEDATHIRIRLFMFDTLSEVKRLDNGQVVDGGVLQSGQEDLRTINVASIRVFTRVIPIPNSFTPTGP